MNFTQAVVIFDLLCLALILFLLLGPKVRIKRTRFWLPGRTKCDMCHRWTRIFMGCFNTAETPSSHCYDPECFEKVYGHKAAPACYINEWADEAENSDDA